MQSLELSTEEIKKQSMPYSPENVGDAPKYPYGTCLYLDSATLDKLGITALPAVGDEVIIHAKAVVKSVSMREQHDGDKDKSCEMQITAMEVSKPSSDADRASRIYPEMA